MVVVGTNVESIIYIKYMYTYIYLYIYIYNINTCTYVYLIYNIYIVP